MEGLLRTGIVRLEEQESAARHFGAMKRR